jgi:site-specific DNA-cytosine methylase
VKWAALIPLIGGQVIGSRAAIGHDPEVLMSYSPFEGNDQYCSRYMPDVPYHKLDEQGIRARWKGFFNIITSTCPCAGLSSFSSAKTGSAQRESKNQWMRDTSKFVLGELKPDVYFGENAPALFSDMGRSVSDFMIGAAEENGYGLTFYKTSTVHHGIPQRRPRTFYAFWRGGKAPLLRWFDRGGTPLARDYLDLARGAAGDDGGEGSPGPFGDLANDSGFQYLKQKYGSGWRNAGGTEEFYDVLDVLMKTQSLRSFVNEWSGQRDNTWRTAKRRLEKLEGNVFVSVPTFPRDGESYPSVIAKYANQFVHPTEDRFLTYREVAWLMGMPLDFRLPPARDFNLVCQNVPVPTARDVTHDPIDFVNGKLTMTDEAVMWYDNTTRRTYAGPQKRLVAEAPTESDVFAA